MIFALNCLFLGEASIRSTQVIISQEISISGFHTVPYDKITVTNVKALILSEKQIDYPLDKLNLWKVDGFKANKNDNVLETFTTEDDIKEKLGGELMIPRLPLKRYFNENSFKNEESTYAIHIIVQLLADSTAGPSPYGVFEDIEQVLRKAESRWTKLKDNLVKKIELKEFRVSNHIYEDSINASGIPMIDKRPAIILHSLPDADNEEGYIPEKMLFRLFEKAMEKRLVFLMGTSGSGKTRFLCELLCKTYGIYFSLNTGHGSKNNNLGSRDMDRTIEDLDILLFPNKPRENKILALRYTRAMLLGRLFILTKLLEFHSDSNFTNFRPKQWLLMQLLPLQIDEHDLWISISHDFRNLHPLFHDELVTTFVKKFHSFVPKQAKLPIAIDESQSAIKLHEKMYPPSNPEEQLRPFFAILLRSVLKLNAWKLCLILSGTGMSFEDILKNSASQSIAKPSGPKFEDFFSIHDGFYEYSEMSKYIQRFLPLDDESMKSIFNIFRGRRRFVVQFLDECLLDDSSMSRDVNENVEVWQYKAKRYIISTFKESCFPKLRSNKEVWNKVMDIVALSMFSTRAMTVRGRGVIEMIQYGFAQLCDLKRLESDREVFQKDVIEVKIAETIPFLAFREYVKIDCHDRNEIEIKLLQDLYSVHYNASCAGFLFEPYLPIVLEKFFNEKICKEHHLFTDIENIDGLRILSYKSTICNLHDNNSTILCPKGDMKKFNLHNYLNDPSTAFFRPEEEAGPDLVCIIEFETPDGIVEVPLFLQAKLWKDSPPSNAIFSTDPSRFYSHGDNLTRSKIELKRKVINCLRTKYHRACKYGLSWIRLLIVYPAEFGMKSHYICTADKLEANELLIIIDSSNAKYFFSSLGINVLNAVERVDRREIDMEDAIDHPRHQIMASFQLFS